MTKIRKIVKDAFKCEALQYQFGVVDIEDGVICKGIAFPTFDDVQAAVNAEFDDAYILGEADNRLDICNDSINQDDPDYCREARQLVRFINKHSKVVA